MEAHACLVNSYLASISIIMTLQGLQAYRFVLCSATSVYSQWKW